MNSFNHYSFGSCTEWMYEYCPGIRPDIKHPNFAKVCFAPFPDGTGRMTSAEGHYDTAPGRITVSWRRLGERFEYTVSAPSGMKRAFEWNGMNVIEYSGEGETDRFLLEKEP